MSDQPLTLAVLAQFHRQVILPDIERIVSSAVDGAEGRLRDEMHTLHDFVLKRLDRLEVEYEAIKAGLGRIEARVDGLEAKVAALDARVARIEAQVLDLQAQVLELRTRLGRVEERLEELIAVEERYPVRAEVQDLKARIDRLQEDIRRIDGRIKP
jgi:predicted  nucleic acid-binding Zn-ribbon protein